MTNKNSLQRRYPGLNYFTAAQRAQFFGRDDEIEELHALILTEKIVTLFGKSGYGKSSLLRAGILPLLGREVVPVLVQFGAYQPGISPTPVERVLAQLDLALPGDHPDSAFLEDISASDTLWHRFKRKQNPALKQFLLVFDQFEEFDSYPAAQRADFKLQLAELLFTRIPQAVRDRSDTLPDAQQTLLSRPLEVKTVFAIREDRLSVLDGLADKLPAILYKRFKLQGLSEKQAIHAIEGPAALPQSDGFLSPAFTYTPEAIQDILAGLEKKSGPVQPDNDGKAPAQTKHGNRVEAFLLQICCENIESSVIQRALAGESDLRIGPADLPPFERLFEAYYRGKIAALPTAAEQTAARRMIEDELVKTDPLTGIAYRLNADGRRLRSLPGVNEALLKRLTDDFLLRSEPNTTGDFNYEVSHDTLVEGILKSKNDYDSAEAQAAAEQQAHEEAERLRAEAIEREQQLAEAEQQRAVETARAEAAERLKNEALEAKKEAENAKVQAEQGRKRARTFAYLAGLVAAVAIGLGIFAFVKQNEAKTASALAKSEEKNAKNALEQVEREKSATEAQRKKAEENSLLAQDKTKEAEKEAENARRALAEQQKAVAAQQAALANVVRLTLKEADKKVYVLDYDGALEVIQSAAALHAAQKEVSDAMLEIVYFFAETGKLDRARSVLDTAASLAGQDLSTVKKWTNPNTREGLRDAIKSLNPDRLAAFDARYFPIMIPIPGGTDTIGEDGEKHAVTLSPFKMAKTETTWWQYNLFCEAISKEKPEKPAGWGGEGDNPVINVSWYDAVAYANWLSAREGRNTAIVKTGLGDHAYEIKIQSNGYRLPTEAEWEYAARAHTPYSYAGSNNLDAVAWYDDNSGSRTHPAAGKKANAFGLYDLSGNVWEWCWDWYGAYDPTKIFDPTGAVKGAYRVDRGGSWDDNAEGCRVSYRNDGPPADRAYDLGFRLSLQ